MDVLSGGPGDDRLHGGADPVCADQGGPGIAGDTLAGGPGDDLLDAGFFVGEDTGNLPHTLTFADAAGPEKVVLRADGYADGEGHDTIVPTDRLTVIGTPYADTFAGSTGYHSVIGGLGNDRIRTRTRGGGVGDDTVHDVGCDDTCRGSSPAGPSRRPAPGRHLRRSGCRRRRAAPPCRRQGR